MLLKLRAACFSQERLRTTIISKGTVQFGMHSPKGSVSHSKLHSAFAETSAGAYSHSMVAGGFGEMS